MIKVEIYQLLHQILKIKDKRTFHNIKICNVYEIIIVLDAIINTSKENIYI